MMAVAISIATRLVSKHIGSDKGDACDRCRSGLMQTPPADTRGSRLWLELSKWYLCF